MSWFFGLAAIDEAFVLRFSIEQNAALLVTDLAMRTVDLRRWFCETRIMLVPSSVELRPRIDLTNASVHVAIYRVQLARLTMGDSGLHPTLELSFGDAGRFRAAIRSVSQRFRVLRAEDNSDNPRYFAEDGAGPIDMYDPFALSMTS